MHLNSKLANIFQKAFLPLFSIFEYNFREKAHFPEDCLLCQSFTKCSFAKKKKYPNYFSLATVQFDSFFALNYFVCVLAKRRLHPPTH